MKKHNNIFPFIPNRNHSKFNPVYASKSIRFGTYYLAEKVNRTELTILTAPLAQLVFKQSRTPFLFGWDCLLMKGAYLLRWCWTGEPTWRVSQGLLVVSGNGYFLFMSVRFVSHLLGLKLWDSWISFVSGPPASHHITFNKIILTYQWREESKLWWCKTTKYVLKRTLKTKLRFKLWIYLD